MSSITIDLPEERMQKLRELAAQLGVSPEELLRASVEGLLNRQDERFKQAAEYVLKKNAELYRRLA
ncbi:MAG: ribbon-helix-helix protein, CopG family [Chloroflexota bacterium]